MSDLEGGRAHARAAPPGGESQNCRRAAHGRHAGGGTVPSQPLSSPQRGGQRAPGLPVLRSAQWCKVSGLGTLTSALQCLLLVLCSLGQSLICDDGTALCARPRGGGWRPDVTSACPYPPSS